jgi:hypothetical protein
LAQRVSAVIDGKACDAWYKKGLLQSEQVRELVTRWQQRMTERTNEELEVRNRPCQGRKLPQEEEDHACLKRCQRRVDIRQPLHGCLHDGQACSVGGGPV